MLQGLREKLLTLAQVRRTWKRCGKQGINKSFKRIIRLQMNQGLSRSGAENHKARGNVEEGGGKRGLGLETKKQQQQFTQTALQKHS